VERDAEREDGREPLDFGAKYFGATHRENLLNGLDFVTTIAIATCPG
jgi:hypothetical protein